MKVNISLRHIALITIASFYFLAIMAGQSALASESYLSSDLKCSMRCEKVRATLAPQTEIISSSEFFVEQTQQANDEYQNIVKKIDEYKLTRQLAVGVLELETRVVTSTVDWLPGVGGMVEFAQDKVLQGLEEASAADLEILIRAELEKVKIKDEDPDLEKFTTYSAKERARRLLTAPDSLFNRLPAEARDHVQNIVIQELAGDLDRIKRKGLKDQKNIDSAIARIDKLERQYIRGRQSKERISNQVERVTSAIKEQNTKEATAPPGNPVKNEEESRKVQQREMLQFSLEMKEAGEQAGAAANVLDLVGAKDLAKGARFLAGCAQFFAGVGTSYVDPRAILPTIEMGLKLFRGTPFGSSSQEAVAVSQQKAILNALNEMERRNQVRYVEIVERLGDIKSNVIFNTKKLDALTVQNLRACPNIFPPPQGSSGQFGFFATYKSLQTFVQTSGRSSIEGCLTGLRVHFSEEKEISSAFMLSPSQIEDALKGTHDPEVNKVLQRQRELQTVFLTQWHQPASEFLRDTVTDIGKQSLIFPSKAVSDLDAKFKALIKKKEKPVPSDTATVSSSSLNPVLIGKYVEFLLLTHPYFEVTDGKTLMSKTALIGDHTVSLEGLQSLKKALEVLNVAIAQQNLIAGDILLPILYRLASNHLNNLEDGPDELGLLIHQDQFKGKDKQAKLHQVAGRLLGTNRLLAKNFMVYFIKQELLKAGYSPVHYYFAYQSKGNADLLQRYLKASWLPHYSAEENQKEGIPQGWYLELYECPQKDDKGNTIQIPCRFQLPKPEELSEAYLYRTPGLVSLIEVRERVMQEIASYKVNQEASTIQQKTWLKRYFMMGVLPGLQDLDRLN